MLLALEGGLQAKPRRYLFRTKDPTGRE